MDSAKAPTTVRGKTTTTMMVWTISAMATMSRVMRLFKDDEARERSGCRDVTRRARGTVFSQTATGALIAGWGS